MLAQAGMKKINFSGGEPFLIQGGHYLGEMVRYCKEELDIQSVTVVSNGSKVTESWMAEYGYYLDIMAVSVDSFVSDVHIYNIYGGEHRYRAEGGAGVGPPREPGSGAGLVQAIRRALQGGCGDI